MRFNCEFEHRYSGECRTIVVSLSLAERESIASLRRHSGSVAADLTAEAYALRKAYAEMPSDFLHTEPPKVMLLA